MAGTGADPTTPRSSGASAGGTTEQAKERAQQVAGQAQEKAQEAKGQARERLRSQVDERSTQYGQQIKSQASDLRSVGEQLRQQGKERPAKMTEQAAERIEKAGSWMADSDADTILNDIEDFARRNPWAVMAGGLVLGMVASRFLKASSSERYQGRMRQLPQSTAGERRFARQQSSTAAGTGTAGSL